MSHYLGFEYCVPSETGLQSEAGAVEKRLTHLLDALSQEVNDHIVQRGELTESIRRLRLEIHEKLQRDGWIVRAREHGEGFVVRHPASNIDRETLADAAMRRDTEEGEDRYHRLSKQALRTRVAVDRGRR